MDNSKANYTNPPVSKVASTVPRLSKLIDAAKEKTPDLKKDSTTTSPQSSVKVAKDVITADNKQSVTSKTSPSSISNVPPPKAAPSISKK